MRFVEPPGTREGIRVRAHECRSVRTPLTLALVALAALAATPAAPAQDSAPPRHVMVLVVDGLNPGEVDDLTPNLLAIQEEGTRYADSRSVLVAETLPNHVAMMTGVLPGRSRIVANKIVADANAADAIDSQDPALIGAGVETLQTTVETRCSDVQTGTVLSKEYLFQIFSAGGRQKSADFHWEPTPQIPESDHAPDGFTTEALLAHLETIDPAKPSFTFVNLGDVDRMGHVDFTGGLTDSALQAQRRLALEDTDLHVGRIRSALEDHALWDDLVLIVVSDHGMDWSQPHKFVDPVAALEDAGYVDSPADEGGDFSFAPNGGAGAIYVHDRGIVSEVAAALKAADLEGVDRILTGSELADLGMNSDLAGDVVVFVDAGYRAARMTGSENAVPGNHGHAVTQHAVLVVSGGHDAVAQGTIDGPDQELLVNPAGRPGTMSVAPTVAALLGLESPNEPFDAPALAGAFDGGVIPSSGACGAAAADAGGGGDGGAEVQGGGSAPTDGTVTPATGGSLGTAVAGLLAVGSALGARRLRRG